MATELHRVHTHIQKLPFVCFSQDKKAIKVIFHYLLTLLITLILKKKTKRKVVVGERNIHIKCIPVNTCTIVFRYFYMYVPNLEGHQTGLGLEYCHMQMFYANKII